MSRPASNPALAFRSPTERFVEGVDIWRLSLTMAVGSGKMPRAVHVVDAAGAPLCRGVAPSSLAPLLRLRPRDHRRCANCAYLLALGAGAPKDQALARWLPNVDQQRRSTRRPRRRR